MAQLEIEERPQAEPVGGALMAGLGREMGKHAVVERRGSAAWSTAAAAVVAKPSMITGMRWMRAARIAPAIAANSRPPTRRSTSSGSSRWPAG